MARFAVVLFNLGGPTDLAAVRPFLFNLFSDPAIIGLAQPWRSAVAWLLAARRAPVARRIYARIGGRSPLFELTGQQADALEKALGGQCRVFIAMRYWHPLTAQTVGEVKAWRPDKVVLLPLYPQYSTTTTASSLRAWREAAKAAGLDVPTTAICCFPTESGLIEAQADLLIQALTRARGNPRVLFSAHGLPKRIVERGDPYPLHVAMTAEAIVRSIGQTGLEWRICYQSKIGPVEWIGPSTEAEVRQAGTDRRAVVVLPIAFVSEHSETLVELDVDYAEVACRAGVSDYVRVPTVGCHPAFVAGLARLVRQAAADSAQVRSESDGRRCPTGGTRCALGEAANSPFDLPTGFG